MNQTLIDYTLHLADNALIIAQRNAELCAHSPILEQDIAITNITLDLIGQSRNFYQYSAVLKADGSTEDSLAYLRDVRAFKNCLITEIPNGDWGQTILRQYFFSSFQFLLFQQLQHSKDEQLAAIATKSLKEITYHVRWSSEWVIRLGDGTEESRNRMIKAIDALWTYTGEFFIPVEYETKTALEGFGVDVTTLKKEWEEKVKAVFEEATLAFPEKSFYQTGGKTGVHTEQLGFILSDLQFLQRAYPGAEW